jgi:hypothetical protein
MATLSVEKWPLSGSCHAPESPWRDEALAIADSTGRAVYDARVRGSSGSAVSGSLPFITAEERWLTTLQLIGS